ncbi:MAG: hypothetical protein PUK40_02005 [Actinomycetaceae bacterium]|nr:hypothetical protein [Arcanobacterium sp.]MDD7504714.1 hypothetical protein [Actinomycetaceae bacterium]MDY6143111.1 hypothetical protein [Arcanobacterium sp.]
MNERHNRPQHEGEQRGHRSRHDATEMDVFIKIMTAVCLLFLAGMAGVGVWMLVKTQIDAAVLVLVVIAAACFLLGVWAARTERPYVLAGATLASGILVPNPWGLGPMIAAFVIFALAIGLAVVAKR